MRWRWARAHGRGAQKGEPEQVFNCRRRRKEKPSSALHGLPLPSFVHAESRARLRRATYVPNNSAFFRPICLRSQFFCCACAGLCVSRRGPSEAPRSLAGTLLPIWSVGRHAVCDGPPSSVILYAPDAGRALCALRVHRQVFACLRPCVRSPAVGVGPRTDDITSEQGGGATRAGNATRQR